MTISTCLPGDALRTLTLGMHMSISMSISSEHVTSGLPTVPVMNPVSATLLATGLSYSQRSVRVCGHNLWPCHANNGGIVLLFLHPFLLLVGESFPSLWPREREFACIQGAFGEFGLCSLIVGGGEFCIVIGARLVFDFMMLHLVNGSFFKGLEVFVFFHLQGGNVTYSQRILCSRTWAFGKKCYHKVKLAAPFLHDCK